MHEIRKYWIRDPSEHPDPGLRSDISYFPSAKSRGDQPKTFPVYPQHPPRSSSERVSSPYHAALELWNPTAESEIGADKTSRRSFLYGSNRVVPSRWAAYKMAANRFGFFGEFVAGPGVSVLLVASRKRCFISVVIDEGGYTLWTSAIPVHSCAPGIRIYRSRL